MNELLDELQLSLTDLMQCGLATAGPDTAKHFSVLSDRCAAAGLHTGAQLAAELSRLMTARLDRMEKSDLEITAALCRMEHYITLCRHRMTEEDIRRRWQQGGNP